MSARAWRDAGEDQHDRRAPAEPGEDDRARAPAASGDVDIPHELVIDGNGRESNVRSVWTLWRRVLCAVQAAVENVFGAATAKAAAARHHHRSHSCRAHRASVRCAAHAYPARARPLATGERERSNGCAATSAGCGAESTRMGALDSIVRSTVRPGGVLVGQARLAAESVPAGRVALPAAALARPCPAPRHRQAAGAASLHS